MPPHLGGIEQIAENLFAGYARRGVSVRWVASQIPSGMPRYDGNRIRVPCFNGVERLFGVPVPIWGSTGWRELARLARWADALHIVECLYIGSGMATVLARRYGKPVVVSQNIGFIEYRSSVLNLIEHLAYATLGRTVLRRASHVVLATPSAERYIPSLLGRQMPPASVFPVGIETRRFRPASPAEKLLARHAIGIASNERVILFAGRLVEKKGVPILVEVARRLPDTRFLVVGDGPLRRLVASAGPNVRWCQTVAPAAMPDYYRASDCVLLPSRGEGLPLVVQEGLASGIPCIISEDEPYASVLAGTGVCHPAPRDPMAIAETVERTLSNPDRSLPALARSYAEQHWSVDAMVGRHLTLLENVLSAAPLRPRAA